MRIHGAETVTATAVRKWLRIRMNGNVTLETSQ